MIIIEKNGKQYRVPASLRFFQQEMYLHLIDWKWEHLTIEPGIYRGNPYDALVPDRMREKLLPIYAPIREDFKSHYQKYPFKFHIFINHMASSQAACANLFLPLLKYPLEASEVLRDIKPDLRNIATERLDSGYRLEFWDEPDNALHDHNKASGTDADIAIAYYNLDGDLCLWMIEHKLTEQEFTTCGGYKSHGRNHNVYKCDSISNILKNNQLCYYAGFSGYRYWDITLDNKQMFPEENLLGFGTCPFRRGLNQLWRNQLLALAIENSASKNWPFKKVYFSVVHHPKNYALQASMDLYRKLIGLGDRFSSFTSDMVINSAKRLHFSPWEGWLSWFEELYYI